MKKPTKAQMQKAQECATRVHAEVCDIHYDHSEMNSDKTCRTCIDDAHELEIYAR